MDEASNNRLSVLAADIRDAHAGAEASALAHANRVLDAGRALIEAKGLVKRGRWLPWLKQHCRLSERTAQLYMKLATLDLPAEIVAHLGLQRAAQTDAPVSSWRGRPLVMPDPLAAYDEPLQREWLLFAAFNRVPTEHAEWLMRQRFASPDAWLADTAYRQRFGMREPSQASIDRWRAFKVEHAETTRAEIEAMLEEVTASAA